MFYYKALANIDPCHENVRRFCISNVYGNLQCILSYIVETQNNIDVSLHARLNLFISIGVPEVNEGGPVSRAE